MSSVFVLFGQRMMEGGEEAGLVNLHFVIVDFQLFFHLYKNFLSDLEHPGTDYKPEEVNERANHHKMAKTFFHLLFDDADVMVEGLYSGLLVYRIRVSMCDFFLHDEENSCRSDLLLI